MVFLAHWEACTWYAIGYSPIDEFGNTIINEENPTWVMKQALVPGERSAPWASIRRGGLKGGNLCGTVIIEYLFLLTARAAINLNGSNTGFCAKYCGYKGDVVRGAYRCFLIVTVWL